MKYAQPLRHATRRHGRWLRTHHRRSAYYAKHVTTRRCQQNPLRWLALWERKKGT